MYINSFQLVDFHFSKFFKIAYIEPFKYSCTEILLNYIIMSLQNEYLKLN